MKPLFQTIFDFENGDCFRACVASILELPIEDVPNFCEGRGENWIERADSWLAERGLLYTEVVAAEDESWMDRHRKIFMIAVGKSPRGQKEDDLHCVICQGGEMVHDPHASGEGLLSVNTYGMLICLHPEKMVRQNKLKDDNDQLMRAMKAAYRKHCLDDPSIGWDELDGLLVDTLSNVLGDKAFRQWRRSINHSKVKP